MIRLMDAIALSRLILKFGQINRITEDANGRLESDTTHTVMLALLAGSMAEHESVPLDRSDVVYLALIHDLAEAYAGDTATLRPLSSAAQSEKDQREAAALDLIRQDLIGFPWILELLDRYEAQSCMESQFVKYVDKIMPKLTHRDNGCRVPMRDGMTRDEFISRHRQQQALLADRYPHLTCARELLEDACRDSEACWGRFRTDKGETP